MYIKVCKCPRCSEKVTVYESKEIVAFGAEMVIMTTYNIDGCECDLTEEEYDIILMDYEEEKTND